MLKASSGSSSRRMVRDTRITPQWGLAAPECAHGEVVVRYLVKAGNVVEGQTVAVLVVGADPSDQGQSPSSFRCARRKLQAADERPFSAGVDLDAWYSAYR